MTSKEQRPEHNSKADPWDQRNTKALTGAIYAVVSKLAERGYLHEPKDVEFVRPGYKSVFGCARVGPLGPLDLGHLQYAFEHGEFWFLWYDGTSLKLNLHKGMMRRTLTLDPRKRNPWEFAYFTVDEFQ